MIVLDKECTVAGRRIRSHSQSRLPADDVLRVGRCATDGEVLDVLYVDSNMHRGNSVVHVRDLPGSFVATTYIITLDGVVRERIVIRGPDPVTSPLRTLHFWRDNDIRGIGMSMP